MILRRTAPALLSAFLMVAVLPVGAAGAADTPTEVLSTSVTPVTANIETGFLTLQVDVELSDPEGLPDHLVGLGPYEHTTLRADGTSPEDLSRRSWLDWQCPVMVSGTPQLGVWRAFVEVAAVQASSFTLTDLLAVEDLSGNMVYVPIDDGATFSIVPPDLWDITPRSAAVPIVTGDELWTPRAIVTARSSGDPVAARVSTHGFGADFAADVHRYPADSGPRPLPCGGTTVGGGPPGVALTSSGLWTGGATSVNGDAWWLLAWGGRGSRGWSLEAEHRMCAPIKWQANSHYSALSLNRGSTLNVTGNVFPAPAVYNEMYPDRQHLYLQQAVGGSWQTVATAMVRQNGRYTLSWTPTVAGTAQLRVRVPGSLTECGVNQGTTLASVAVTVR